MNNFYAVGAGIKPGIYLTWKECENNVKGFYGAKYKKFNTKTEAQKYIDEIKENTKTTSKTSSKSKKNKSNKDDKNNIVTDDYNFKNCINVYTDGSCVNNGYKNAVAGCGIYFEKDDSRNASFKLKNKKGYNLTNNRAELKAILYAIKILKSEIEQGKIVIIHTDSKYSIISFTSNNLEQKKPQDVPNYDYVVKGNDICKKYSNIKFHHIKAHTGKKDIHSVGNENADELANLGLKKNSEDTIITFGKYKNKSFEEIYQIDKKYLLWCVDNIKTDNIKSFLETKNMMKKSDDAKNDDNLVKLKKYKVNGVRCVKENNCYYDYTNNNKGKLFAIINENNEVELIE